MEDNANPKDRHLSLFVDDRALVHFQRIATEVMECVTQQKLVYYAIEGTLSKTDELYGESTDKVFRQPIEIYALILYNSPLVKTGSFSSETQYSLKFYIQKYRLEDYKLNIRQGDFVEFGDKIYEITIVTEPQLIAGMGDFGYRMGIYCDCISTRSDVFNPKRNTKYDPSTNPDTTR